MFNAKVINEFNHCIFCQDGISDKILLSDIVQKKFGLIRDRSVFYGQFFAVRFCTASNIHFSNTVLSLSALRKYDSKPFFVCLVTPTKNYLFISNSTFIKKISHSSQELREDNIKGSFNGSDILRDYEGITNTPENFEYLFTSHQNYSFEENLVRLVESTNSISPTGRKSTPTDSQRQVIFDSVNRAIRFLRSSDYQDLSADLGARVSSVESEIAIAAFIDNVNLRGRIIEYLITEENDLKATLIRCLQEKRPLPEVFTSDNLGDYEKNYKFYLTATDIKTKILFLSSNPKGYNIDKLLEFLSTDKSVYLVYIVAIAKNRSIKTKLCSMYNRQLLSGTRIIKHWAGRNSRGVTQYDGKSLEDIIENFDPSICADDARDFLVKCLSE